MRSKLLRASRLIKKQSTAAVWRANRLIPARLELRLEETEHQCVSQSRVPCCNRCVTDIGAAWTIKSVVVCRFGLGEAMHVNAFGAPHYRSTQPTARDRASLTGLPELGFSRGSAFCDTYAGPYRLVNATSWRQQRGRYEAFTRRNLSEFDMSTCLLALPNGCGPAARASQ
jgi:hypothetical protein